jgi:hypothetical protein
LHFSQLQLTQLPPEISFEILKFLPIQELLTTRLVCKHYQNLIDNGSSLQSKITYYSLIQKQSKCNIPLDDLKMYVTHDKLSVEANGNLCLWKLINEPELNDAISRVSHLFIKNGEPKELTLLFTKLLQNNRLSVLYLFNCELNAVALEKLHSLLTPEDQNLRPLLLYLCNLRLSGCEWPSHWSGSDNVKMIVADEGDEYSIEKILSKDSDLQDVFEFEKQVHNEELPAETIVKKMMKLNPVIQAGIVSSIWYSILIPTSSMTAPAPTKNIVKRLVFNFIFANPHHAALKAAISKNGKIFNCTSS